MLNEYISTYCIKNSDTANDIENMYDIRWSIFIPNYKVIFGIVRR